jgi:hypothetical protein
MKRACQKSTLILGKLSKAFLHSDFFLLELFHLLVESIQNLVSVSQPLSFQVEGFDVGEVEEFLVGAVGVEIGVFLFFAFGGSRFFLRLNF